MPDRIQRKRLAGWRAPLDARGRKPKYVGRGTPYGNPFRVVPDGRDWAVRVDPADGVTGRTVGHYASQIEARKVAVEQFRSMLRTPGGAEQAEHFARTLHGRDLMCWCPLPAEGEPDHCHAAVLLELCRAAEGAQR